MLGVNSLFGLFQFYREAKKVGIEAVVGLTVPNTVYAGFNYEVTFYPHNWSGYQNLVQISSLVMESSASEFVLNQHLSLLNNLSIVISIDDKENEQTLLQFFDYLEKQTDNVFLGVKNLKHDLKYYKNKQLLPKLLAFLPVHYLESDEVSVYQVLLAIKQQIAYSTVAVTPCHFQPLSSLETQLGDHTFLLANVKTFLAKINLVFPERFSLNLKKFAFPQQFRNSFEYLQFCCQEKLKRLKLDQQPAYQTRLNFELEIVLTKKFTDYFLIVADYVSFAISKNILVGPGRGSASGSLIAYLLGITKVDPLAYDLIFERFLNPARNQIPDIDLDFEDQRRNEVLEYIFAKYPPNHVAQIATFQKIAFKLAIRDIGKALNIPNFEIDKITKSIPLKFNHHFQEALQNKLSLRTYQKKYPQLFTLSEKIIGLPRHLSIHAAGIVITQQPITDTVAT